MSVKLCFCTSTREFHSPQKGVLELCNRAVDVRWTVYVPGHLLVLAVQRLQLAHLLFVLRLPHLHPHFPSFEVRYVVHDIQLQVKLAASGRRCRSARRIPAVHPRPFARKRSDRLAPVPAEQWNRRLRYCDNGMPAAGCMRTRRPRQGGQERFLPGRRTGRTLVAEPPYL